jgi:hypothetical protein
MADFTAEVYQNEFLPDGGTDVHAIVTVTCTGAGVAGQTGDGGAAEIVIVDTSASTAPGLRSSPAPTRRGWRSPPVGPS